MAEAAIGVIYGGITIAILIRSRNKLFFLAFLAVGGLNIGLLQLLKILIGPGES